MRQVTNITTVQVPAEELWDYLAHYESSVRIATDTARATLKSGTPGIVGATYEASLEWEGIGSSWVAHLKQADRPNSLTWESCSHGGECWMRFELTPIDPDSTSLAVTLAWGANKPNAPLEPFAWGLITPMLKRAMRKLHELTPQQIR